MRSHSILLIVGGGIAAYKSLELIRRVYRKSHPRAHQAA